MKRDMLTAIAGGVFSAGAILFLVAVGQPAFADRQSSVVKASDARCVSSPISRIQVVSANQLVVQDRAGNAALLKLSGNCLRDPSVRIGLEFSSASSALCDKNDVTVHGQLGPTIDLTCSVSSMRALSSAEANGYLNGSGS